MGTMTKILVVFTMINAVFFVWGLTDGGILNSFINTDADTPVMSDEFKESIPNVLKGSSFAAGITDNFFKLVDSLAAVIKFIGLVLGFIGAFILFSSGIGMPPWFTYLIAVPYTVAYAVAIISFIRGTPS